MRLIKTSRSLIKFIEAKKVFVLFFLVGTGIHFTYAQDYPYDDTQFKKEDSSGLPKETNRSNGEDTRNYSDNQDTGRAVKGNRLPSLFRLSIKGGGNFSIFQSPTGTGSGNTQVSGFGFEGLLSMGWDLPYQPVFIEFEVGYRNLFLTADDTLNSIPVILGVHYRQRIGARSLWKPGIEAGLDIRILGSTIDDTTSRLDSFGVFPFIGFGSQLEFGPILFEPIVTLNRLQKDHLFMTFACRGGLRF